MANKIGLQFKGWEDLIVELDEMQKDAKKAVDEALKKSKEYVTKNAEREIARHRRTGRTQASLDTDNRVVWHGDEAETDVGFHIRKGGLPSIFLMYGTPRMAKDKKLYDAIYGTKTKREVARIQEEEIRKVLEGR